jgi:hypothetical protein
MVLVRGLYRRVNQSASNGASKSMYQVYNNPNLNNRQNPVRPLTQQVLNGQIGSPKSFEFQEFFSQGKQRLRTLIFLLMFPYVPNFNP